MSFVFFGEGYFQVSFSLAKLFLEKYPDDLLKLKKVFRATDLENFSGDIDQNKYPGLRSYKSDLKKLVGVVGDEEEKIIVSSGVDASDFEKHKITKNAVKVALFFGPYGKNITEVISEFIHLCQKKRVKYVVFGNLSHDGFSHYRYFIRTIGSRKGIGKNDYKFEEGKFIKSHRTTSNINWMYTCYYRRFLVEEGNEKYYSLVHMTPLYIPLKQEKEEEEDDDKVYFLSGIENSCIELPKYFHVGKSGGGKIKVLQEEEKMVVYELVDKTTVEKIYNFGSFIQGEFPETEWCSKWFKTRKESGPMNVLLHLLEECVSRIEENEGETC